MAGSISLSPGLLRKLDGLYAEAEILRLGAGDKLVVFSDLHLGDGSKNDDFRKNADLFLAVMRGYYLDERFILALNGDIEELARFPLARILRRWQEVYRAWGEFAARGALFKLVGNHDLALQRRPAADLPFPVRESLRVEIGTKRLWLFHGHQLSRLNWAFQTLGILLLRWLLNPLGFGNYTVARSSRRRFNVERRAYEYARMHQRLAAIGHTHRPLFESLSRLEAVKIEIENLCRRYAQAPAGEQPALRRQLARLKGEHLELQRRDRKPRRSENLYHDGPLLPCLFNSGCGIGRHGITAIEVDARFARLVYWVDRRRSEKFIESEGYEAQRLGDSDYFRVVLKQEELDYIFTRIELLG